MDFRFDDNGAVTAIHTEARWGRFDGGFRQVAWEGNFHDYEQIGGFRVPTRADVGWYVGGDWQPVWEAEMTDFSFE